jgi:glyoxylase-like metal-dependent hydrolase (beta-lactamase superfamily II)
MTFSLTAVPPRPRRDQEGFGPGGRAKRHDARLGAPARLPGAGVHVAHDLLLFVSLIRLVPGLVDEGYELGPGLSLAPLPGHTPGQMGVRVDGAVRALFRADAIHSPLQVLDPGLSTAVCVDREQARQVRRELLEEAAEECRLVVPAHFRGTRCMHIRRTAIGFTPCFTDPGF